MDDRGQLDAAAAVVAAELRLLDPEVRQDAAAVDGLLDPAFREIGQSGRLWSRQDMVEALADAAMSDTLGAPVVSQATVEQLAPGTYLLTYLLASGSGLTRRSSIWRATAGGWRCVFHQGTRAEDG
ncbi:DUF4440 domain-containing protein [Subtercola boreus]|uniref:DUF4440 domain-containing protein n=1 Tax=Subtercola boreus TaxID=120213 RepID=A0A3E0WF03_9MICO|nr:DUF4440 domain-containing protein [Subtercola boreus]RFA23606.1 hypothetical protein B7R24_01645 [Subtercola boreus]RFA24000.1 hypothetical protein B7R23_01645 [Subtercola boreus]RFA29698.1 hypothetical protein B7R25_01640 [Subtercola boreus]